MVLFGNLGLQKIHQVNLYRQLFNITSESLQLFEVVLYQVELLFGVIFKELINYVIVSHREVLQRNGEDILNFLEGREPNGNVQIEKAKWIVGLEVKSQGHIDGEVN